jgi:hypothetical protein
MKLLMFPKAKKPDHFDHFACKWVYRVVYIYNILGVCLSGRPSPWGKGVKVSMAFINAFPWLPFLRSGPLHYLPPFNTTTLIKPMKEEKEEVPLEDLRFRQNCLAWEKHAAGSEEQPAVDTSCTQQCIDLKKGGLHSPKVTGTH